MALASSLSPEQADFLARLLERFRADTRIAAVLAGGSYLANALDQYSDLDLVIAVEPGAYPAVMVEREALAASLGGLLESFSGEHVGEPRLLICLYERPLLHVDLKFVELPELSERVEDPVVLWERAGRARAALALGDAEYPTPDASWLERRFWVWVHYTATKIGRGELFEALHTLDYLRAVVLGPLGLLQVGARPAGVRRVESAAPELAQRLEATVAKYDAADCLRALRACTEVYRWLRPTTPTRVEAHVMSYLATIALPAP
jgi:hypothetical protein